MNKQCLQHILFPKLDVCTETELYFRNGRTDHQYRYLFNNEIEFEENVCVDFGTYFNAFSFGTWKKYTVIDNINLKLVLKGKFELQVYQMELVNNDVIRKILKKCDIDFLEKSNLDVGISAFESKGQIGFSLIARDNEAIFYGGEYYTKCNNEIKLPRIGVDICTYHREEYVYRNFSNIKKYLDENKNSVLERQIDFWIVDNGESLDEERLDIPNVKIIRQHDCGSTGGFTRGMIEIINNTEVSYDYVLLMDDDILFEPEIIERTCLFEAFIKTEYKDHILGGGNMDLSVQWMQHESGGFFDEFGYTTLGQYYDLRNPYFLLRNEYEKNATTSAWWYCCLPHSYVQNNNLPYPFFFHKEDMEYSYRSSKSIILLNGIGVWHESFFNKQPSWHTYYDTRNLLILDTLHFPEFNKQKAKKILFKNMISSIIRYRYKECDFIIEAYEDYLKGPLWLRKYDNAEYLEEKIRSSYVIGEITMPLNYKAYEDRINHQETKLRRMMRKLTLNGYLLPANKTVIAPISGYNSYVAFRAKTIVNYDFIRQRGFITIRSYKSALRCVIKMFGMFIELDIKFRKSKNEYKQDFTEAIKLETWKKKLNLE